MNHSIVTGFSYVEVLIAALIVALALNTLSDAVITSGQSTQLSQQTIERYYRVLQMHERVLAQSYSALDAEAVALADPNAASSYSDGTTAVYLSRYDGDNADDDSNPFTGVDANLLWVAAEDIASGYKLETLTTP